ncbi:MAG TPA: hypothetical protein VEK57_06110 [Thermoanaerobaculia bacterium]|nr:hypothetical protein [Thermoanaerobaculia bacterium]
MPDHLQYQDEDLFNPDTAHEHSDVPVKGLLWFIVIFIIFSVISYFIVLLLYNGLVKAERKRSDPPRTTVDRPASADVPQNQPLLQPFPRNDGEGRVIPPQANTPVTDLVDMRAAEDKVLQNYGWVDKGAGIVHMPIAVAKEVMAAKLAVEGQLGGTPAATTTAPLSTPAPSGQPVPADTGTVPATNTGAQQ